MKGDAEEHGVDVTRDQLVLQVGHHVERGVPPDLPDVRVVGRSRGTLDHRRVTAVVAPADEADRRVEGDAHLGLLGGGAPVVGIDLDEIAARQRARPDRLVEPPVERDRLALGEARGDDRRAAAVAGSGLTGRCVLSIREQQGCDCEGSL
ncbi:MAG: hypothetical protein EXQ53_06885 [Acidobacteria bacterium]|nr:hypothetical protein [Acidobacteriota bacterium]